MENVPIHTTLRLITTHLKVVVKNQHLLLQEQQKQTAIAEQVKDHLLSGPLLVSGAKEAKRKKQVPAVLSTVQVAQLLGLSETYSPAKVRELKKKLNVKEKGPLSLTLFCKATGLSYKEVMHSLDYE